MTVFYLSDKSVKIKNKKEAEIIEKINKRFLGLAGNQGHIFTVPEWTIGKEMTTITSPFWSYCSNPRCKRGISPILFIDPERKCCWLRNICSRCRQWTSIQILIQDIVILKPQDKGDGLLYNKSWDKIWDEMLKKNINDATEKELKKLRENKKNDQDLTVAEDL